MVKDELRQLLEDVKNNRVDVGDALNRLKNLPYEDLGFAVLDHHRALRKGFPEVVFCQGKTVNQVAQIFKSLCGGKRSILGTRASREAYEAVREIYPDAVYHELARIIVVQRGESPVKKGNILVMSAGTADIPVAEEAAITAEIMGNNVRRLYDVGVAGIHRLLDKLETIRWAHVVIVVAGMEGALASVVGGLCDQPMIAVPTSVGYGASFNGLSALLCMLNSCASGVGVVNIDNGFGAAAMANAITQMLERVRTAETKDLEEPATGVKPRVVKRESA
ncbi:MAG TPA: nickel pincer cofactor biosynthesis protein LarB [Bacillota bacterium]|mgnify:FL=1|jgi:NCAIR mutase (PurE)-related protein|nr:nickel pincer cofactor biosynthesis protein LarB [Peptococcaceae bacterium MAG4]NLW38579.1 nickel pincer cofactor biosynthesis protein LarB [Peptococcaceae bacterium]HPU35240.1 nickel pincer cofactor biosynthesis protein LarB [Bacillota bacterium]HPZ42804.1 nickel pincer cofactor biosynthesis protein LarB [Bacillota bacterium]HQD75319.1 nickel pincer cofactor biosynthesis protein LarB [Bacillota bacterium]